jgi:hypothetical protein
MDKKYGVIKHTTKMYLTKCNFYGKIQSTNMKYNVQI